MDYFSQACYVLAWAGLLKLLQMSVWPHLRPALGRYAYPVSYPLSLLLFTLISWYSALLQIPIQLSLIVFLGLAASGITRGGYTLEELRGLAVWDAIFLLGFLFALEVRFINPVINHFSEQFMNQAFLASIMLNPQVPPLDPWFSGGDLSVYYYLGHFMMGMLGSLVAVPSEVVFNLILPTVFGLSFLMLYAMGDLILPRFRWMPLAVLFAIPPSVLWFLSSGCDIYGALDRTNWLIAGGRFEFPLFSLFLGNAHAFEIGLFNQLLLLFLLAFAGYRWGALDVRGRVQLVLLLSLTLGTMPLLNAWDALIYGPLVLAFILYMRYRDGRDAPHLWTPALLVSLVALGCYLPYYLQLQPSGVQGIGYGFGPTDVFSFIGLWGVFLLILYLNGAREMRKSPGYLLSALPFLLAGYFSLAVSVVPLVYLIRRRKYVFPELLCMAGLTILLFCEVFYFKERLGGDYSRFNTIFKFYYTSWVLLGSGSLLLAGAWLSRRRPLLSPTVTVQRLAAAGVAAALLITPFVLQMDIGKGLLNIQHSSGYYTLDGMDYLEGDYPGDAAAIDYLKGLSGDHRIVEAEYGDYSYFSRVSTFTGIPTILGQRAHELTWRGNSDGWYWERPRDIRAIYEEPDTALLLMDKYNMTLLYVGEPERERYNVSLPEAGLKRIYDEGGVQIYERER